MPLMGLRWLVSVFRSRRRFLYSIGLPLVILLLMIRQSTKQFGVESSRHGATSRKLTSRDRLDVSPDSEIKSHIRYTDNQLIKYYYNGQRKDKAYHTTTAPEWVKWPNDDKVKDGRIKHLKNKLFIIPGKKRRNIQLYQTNRGKRTRLTEGTSNSQYVVQAVVTPMRYKPDVPVRRAPKPSTGEPWPAPRYMKLNTSYFLVDPHVLDFITLGSNCDILQSSITRFKERLLEMKSRASQQVQPTTINNFPSLLGIQIKVQTECTMDYYPSLDSDETYNMVLRDNIITIHSSEVWGALYGIETLSQLIKEEEGQLLIRGFQISDSPRFKHRGIMIDTSRHFISLPIIKTNLDAMAMNKMNVLHWHIVDDQSFPYESKTFPELSVQGAFSPTSVYTLEDIKDIIEYARQRGIRVIPEFDLPGHVQSWVGLSHILTPCDSESSYGPVDPTKNITYMELAYLFSEVLDVFPDQTVHFGGDECSYYCWSKSEEIKQFMLSNSMDKYYPGLFNLFIRRLRNTLIAEQLKPKNSIYWQEVFDEGVEIDKDDIIQVWKGGHSMKLSEITMRGHKVLLSSCWYLNYVKYGTDWQEFYNCDPLKFSGNPEQKSLVLGGEACMWGEYVDDTNLLQELWPRASAVAERLWSSFAYNDAGKAAARFEENRCRMVRNGIPASPNSGPGPNC